MSTHAVEKVLWEIGHDPEKNVPAMMQEPDIFFSRYNLTEDEKKKILEMDVKSLTEQGASPLLAMMVWPIIKGPETMPFGYLEQLSGGEIKGPPA